jgi:hypothetical protein
MKLVATDHYDAWRRASATSDTIFRVWINPESEASQVGTATSPYLRCQPSGADPRNRRVTARSTPGREGVNVPCFAYVRFWAAGLCKGNDRDEGAKPSALGPTTDGSGFSEILKQNAKSGPRSNRFLQTRGGSLSHPPIKSRACTASCLACFKSVHGICKDFWTDGAVSAHLF